MTERPKGTRSKRSSNAGVFTSVTGIVIENKKCRVCLKVKHPRDFPEAVDVFLDRDGLMSVCFECIDDIYNKFFTSEKSLDLALLRLCRLLNVAYLDEAIEATKNTLEKRPGAGVFSLYKIALMQTQKAEIGHRKKTWELGLTFVEPVTIPPPANPLTDEDYADEMFKFWGEGLDKDDYDFLERELDDWKKTHKSDTKAELTLLKEICFKQLDIKKKRLERTNPSGLVKELQELMKTANVDPAKASLASAGKSMDTFSAFIKTIEENEPAEYYKDKNLFKDFDNIDWYFKKYVTRPLKNFITGSRDFSVEKEIDEPDEFDDLIFTEVEDE